MSHQVQGVLPFCFSSFTVTGLPSRRLIGRWYLYMAFYPPAFLASVCAILCERKSRSVQLPFPPSLPHPLPLSLSLSPTQEGYAHGICWISSKPNNYTPSQD